MRFLEYSKIKGNQRWLIGGISHPMKKIPVPMKSLSQRNPGDKKSPKNPVDKNPQIFENPRSPGI